MSFIHKHLYFLATPLILGRAIITFFYSLTLRFQGWSHIQFYPSSLQGCLPNWSFQLKLHLSIPPLPSCRVNHSQPCITFCPHHYTLLKVFLQASVPLMGYEHWEDRDSVSFIKARSWKKWMLRKNISGWFFSLELQILIAISLLVLFYPTDKHSNNFFK